LTGFRTCDTLDFGVKEEQESQGLARTEPENSYVRELTPVLGKAELALARIVITLILVILVSAAMADDRRYWDGAFGVEVDPVEISFRVDGPPGIYDSEAPVNVSVMSGYADWTLYCQATPLVEITKGWVLPSDRLCLAGVFRDIYEPTQELVGLGEPLVIGTGSFTGPDQVLTSVLDVKLRCEWNDRPGIYQGQIIFTFLAMP
jgi:hypothetical protein